MRRALTGAVIIGAATLLEAVRNRLLLVSLFFAVVLIGLSVTAASVSIGEQARLIIDVGLAAASGFGSIMVLALAISSFAGELQKRTAYPVLARPLPRWAFVLGKYLGVVTAMELVVLLMLLATAATVWLFGAAVPAALWACMWLTMVEVAVVAAVALLFSTLTVPVLAATYTVGVVLAGNLAGGVKELAARLEAKEAALGAMLRWAYYVLPDLEKLSLRGQAANNLPVPADFMLHGTLYGVAYAAAALALAALVFSRRWTV